jgi:hypothetical protein
MPFAGKLIGAIKGGRSAKRMASHMAKVQAAREPYLTGQSATLAARQRYLAGASGQKVQAAEDFANNKARFGYHQNLKALGDIAHAARMDHSGRRSGRSGAWQGATRDAGALQQFMADRARPTAEAHQRNVERLWAGAYDRQMNIDHGLWRQGLADFDSSAQMGMRQVNLGNQAHNAPWNALAGGLDFGVSQMMSNSNLMRQNEYLQNAIGAYQGGGYQGAAGPSGLSSGFLGQMGQRGYGPRAAAMQSYSRGLQGASPMSPRGRGPQSDW